MYRGKKILAVVPARGGSKGIKLKNLRTINSVSLVGMVGKCVKELTMIDKVILSTDHKLIADEGLKNGIEVPFMRPKELSGDFISDWQVLDHALSMMEEIESTIFDIIIMLQPTSPLRKPDHIKRAIVHLIENDFDSVWTISKTDSKFHPQKQLVLNENEFNYYEENGKNIIARQQLSDVYHRNGICYVFTRNCIKSYKEIKGAISGYLIINEPSISIDTEEDILKVKNLLKD